MGWYLHDLTSAAVIEEVNRGKRSTSRGARDAEGTLFTTYVFAVASDRGKSSCSVCTFEMGRELA